MKIQIEDERIAVTIVTKSKDISPIDAVQLCYRALIGMSYHPRSISDAMSEVGEEKS